MARSPDPLAPLFGGLSTPFLFFLASLLTLTCQPWSVRWFLSGTPLLCYLLLLGPYPNPIFVRLHDISSRDPPSHAVFAVVTVINTIYILTSTSWLFTPLYNILCYPFIVLLLLLRSRTCRVVARRLLDRNTQYFADKVAFFSIPALVIDKNVTGMMVVQGATVSISDLSLTAHGVELGLKIMDGVEIAIRTEEVCVKFGRGVRIGDVYANLKTDGSSSEGDSTPPSPSPSPFLLDGITDEPEEEEIEVTSKISTPRANTRNSREDTIDELTDNNAPPKKIDSDTIAGAVQQAKQSTETLVTDEVEIERLYEEKLKHIEYNSAISVARRKLQEFITGDGITSDDDGDSVHSSSVSSLSSIFSNRSGRSNTSEPRRRSRSRSRSRSEKQYTESEKRALLSTFLQSQLSITSTPESSIAVTKIQSLTRWWQHLIARKQPWTIRLILNLVCYLHPVKVSSIIASGQGNYISDILKKEVFKHYRESSADVRRLACRVENWLDTGNFCVQIDRILGLAQVPVTVEYDIKTGITTGGVKVHKVLLDDDIGPAFKMADETTSKSSRKNSYKIRDKEGLQREQEDGISRCVVFGGVSASLTIPIMLLPHHQWLFPPRPRYKKYDEISLRQTFMDDDSTSPPQQHNKNEQSEEDSVDITLAILASLPMEANSTVLHFVSALVKATKLIDLQQQQQSDESEAPGEERKSVGEWSKHVNKTIKEGLKRGLVANTVDDAWIAKLVGKVLGAMEDLKGDVGYKMPIKVDLVPRRVIGERERNMGIFG